MDEPQTLRSPLQDLSQPTIINYIRPGMTDPASGVFDQWPTLGSFVLDKVTIRNNSNITQSNYTKLEHPFRLENSDTSK